MSSTHHTNIDLDNLSSQDLVRMFMRHINPELADNNIDALVKPREGESTEEHGKRLDGYMSSMNQFVDEFDAAQEEWEEEANIIAEAMQHYERYKSDESDEETMQDIESRIDTQS